ncbi:hypothetical protein WJX72_001237 [[Myrmecia] bisecta]|uniref:Fe/B12 periplasmic-binding domain-containing protein n=1 Tax=[Myrmecia] bisecta TaxID=41462 RepID=A0AAW1R5D9_9CHLO
MKVIVIGGTSSGVGKTSLSVGLMAALRRRGLRVQAFKVGPDFLDPLHHEAATGRASINLDGWMMDRDQNLACFHRHTADADIAVVEGVMGLFDGRDGKTEAGSTAQMAKWLGASVVLVLDCWAIARSAAAIIKGYQDFDPDLKLGGVLLNKVGGPAHTQWLQEAVDTSGVSVKVLGGVPKDDSVTVKERYLGLHMPGDEDTPKEYIGKLASLVADNVDMEALLEVAATADVPMPTTPLPASVRGPSLGQRLRIGVAKDAAFGFYYFENLSLLESAGAELVFFSPMTESLPANLAGLYFGGGYPEKHAAQLASNVPLLAAVKAFAEAGGVVYAECGGLVYLSQSIQPLGEPQCNMVGVFPFRTHMTKDKMKMGYVEVQTQANCPLFPANATVRGHVFHFSEILQESVVPGFTPGSKDEGWQATYKALMQTPGAEQVPEGYTRNNVVASYVHLHFGSNPAFAESLVRRCQSVDVGAVDQAASEAAELAYSVRVVPAEYSPQQPPVLGRSSGGGMVNVLSAPNLQLISARSSGDGSDEWALPERGKSHTLDIDRSRSQQLSSSYTHNSYMPQAQDAQHAQHGDFFGSAPQHTTGYLDHFGSAGAIQQQQPLKEHGLPHSVSSSALYARERSHAAASSSGRPSDDHRHWVRDPAGHFRPGWHSPTPSDSIVSLLPSGTEILFALGLGNRVMGVTDHCDFPKEAAGRPRVCTCRIDFTQLSSAEVEARMQELRAAGTSPTIIDWEWLAREQPGLVLTQDSCRICDADSGSVAEALNKAGLLGPHAATQLMTLTPRTISDVMDSILEVGQAAGVAQEAVRLVDRLRARLRAVATEVARCQRRPRVLSLEGLSPLCLGGQWLPEMKELAGGADEWLQPGDQPLRITWDQVRQYAPEVLVLSPCSAGLQRALGEACELAALPGWWALPAVKTGQVYICDHACFSRPGPRLVDGVEILSRILHPDLVSKRVPEKMVLKLSLHGGQRCRQRLLPNYFVPYS